MATQYDILRQQFNPVITGKSVNAILKAISIGDELIRYNSKNMYLNLFTKTASGPYLDILGNNSGIERPPEIGISDLAYSKIISTTINKQNDSNALLNILDIYFSPFQTRAYIQTDSSENFTLVPGDLLSVLVDDQNTYQLVFNSNDFNDISSISALDLANVITAKLTALNSDAYAIPSTDSSGALRKVAILSNTLGSKSSISVIGGKANNTLKFSQFLNTTQDNTTQFTVKNYTSGTSGLSGITTRFVWSGGTNPNLSIVAANDYVNIFGTGFNSSNQGTYTITNVVNGPVNFSYFEVINSSSTTQSVTLSTVSDITFFSPVRRFVGSDAQFASIFEAVNNEIDIFLPAGTAVVERTPTTGGAYLADKYATIFVGTNTFTIGETVTGTTSKATGIVISLPTNNVILGDITGTFVVGELLFGETSGFSNNAQSISLALDNKFKGDYLVDFKDYVITNTSTNLSLSIIANSQMAILKVNSTVGFGASGGFLRIDMGLDNEEDVIPYETILTSTDILLDASYKFKYSHSTSADVTYIKNKLKYQSPGDDKDLASYLTDVANARQSAVNSLSRIEASGIKTTVTIEYPGDTGLGNAGTANSDIVRIYGE
jgi:hypothetical protein